MICLLCHSGDKELRISSLADIHVLSLVMLVSYMQMQLISSVMNDAIDLGNRTALNN